MISLPHHVAIIMDGNGRWAKERGLPRIAGHKVGLESVRAVIEGCIANKITVLTLFAFSTENWLRPEAEVNYLLNHLFIQVLTEELKLLQQKDVKLCVMGDVTKLNSKLQNAITRSETLTSNNKGLKLVLALNYSGQWDILRAVKLIVQQVVGGSAKSTDISHELIQQNFCLSDLPFPDLLIRTSGEQRISNFMLWQLAYTELYFTDVLWPDFREPELLAALQAYAARQRRFGKC